MGRKSVKEDKNKYFALREEQGLSREQACDLLNCVSVSRLSKIEYGEALPYPEEIFAMANAYKDPSLCNFYCSNDCPLGQKYVPQVEVKELPVVTLEILALLNRLVKEKERLIEITVDGNISEDEIADFLTIREDLAKMSLTIDSLQMWIDNKIAEGIIRDDLIKADHEGAK